MANKQNRKTGKFIDGKLILKVLQFTQPYKKTFRLTFLLTLLLALLGPIRPWLVQVTIDKHVLNGNIHGVVYLGLIMLALLLLETGLQYLQSYYSGWIGQTVIRDLRKKIYAHLISFQLAYFNKTPVGTVVTRVVNDIETIADMFGEGLMSIAGDLLKLIIVLGVMLWLSPAMTLISIIPLPLLLISTHIFKNGIKQSFTEVRNEVANLNAFTQEHITGMLTIQAFNKEEDTLKKFKTINKRHEKAHIKSVLYYSIFFPVVELLQAASIALLVWWGTREMSMNPMGEMQPGSIVSFILYIYMLYRPMRQLADRFNTLQMGVVSAERLFSLLDENAKTQDNGGTLTNHLKGKIAFQNIHFEYLQDQPILKNINFQLLPGKKLALVGATGSGKSTIVNLLSRLYEPHSGTILLDDIPIQKYKLNELYHAIAVVPQDVFLFSDSIFNNITLFNPSVSFETVQETAKKIGAHDFIMNLPGNYEFNVRERGGMLSAGQRQLLAFCRAMVHNPKILILDEATSAVDTESEILIQQATETITQNRTAIIIAHRLSTIKNVDLIIVLNQGEILEMGSHDELLKANGHYKHLHDLQFVEV